MSDHELPEEADGAEDPFTTVEANTSLSDEERELVLGLRRPVKSEIAKTREKARTFITYSVIGATLVLGGVIAFWDLKDGNARDALAGVFTPIIGLAGVVLGFYFGGKDSTT